LKNKKEVFFHEKENVKRFRSQPITDPAVLKKPGNIPIANDESIEANKDWVDQNEL